MKLLINTATLRGGGAVQVALSFINECKVYSENEYHVLVGLGLKRLIHVEEYPSNYFFYFFDWEQITLFNLLNRGKKLSKIESQIKPDCIISTSGPSYFPSNAPQLIGYNLPIYIYPESPYFSLLSSSTKIKLDIKKIIHKYFFRRDGDAFFVQTDDVNKRTRIYLKTDNIFTITNTCSSFYRDYIVDTNKKILPEKCENEIRLLTLSAYYLHKNLEIIPKLIDELYKRGYDNVKFVLTLKDDVYSNLIPYKYRSSVYNVGYVKPIDCPALYDECDIMFLPTLLECFSASYPEAMIMKKPIITTDMLFAHIVCKDSALYFKPMDAQKAVDCIIEIMTNKELTNRLITKGLAQLKEFDTPEQRAKKILQICKHLVAKEELITECFY